MDLVVELNDEDTKRENFHIFKNVSFDPRAIAKIVYFVVTRNQPKAVFTVLNFF